MPKRFPLPDFAHASSPPFHTLDSEAFENLCLDLGYHQCKDSDGENAVQIGLYEEKGVKQFGADWYLQFDDGSMIIGSCKAHESPSKGVIVDETAGEIVKHWDSYWSERNVHMVALCFGADARQGARRDNIEKARNMIRALGIRCEIWSSERLTNDLRPFPTLVSKHLGSAWVHEICDRLVPTTGERGYRAIAQSYADQVTAFEEGQHVFFQGTLDRLRRKIREGDAEGAAALADEIANSLQWAVMSEEQQADVLRLKASALLIDEFAAAESAFKDAQALFPPKDRVLTALFKNVASGHETALGEVNEPRTVRERHLKAALLIEAGRVDDAVELLGDEPEPRLHDELERLRLVAITSSIQRKSEAAIEAARQLEASDSKWVAGKQACLIARYFSTISSAFPVLSLDWPEPMPTAFIRNDPTAHAVREETIAMLMAEIAATSDKERQAWLSVWRFALLCDCDGRRDEADSAIEAAINTEQFHPGLVVWGLSRRISMDGRRITPRLAKLAEDGEPTAAAAMVAFRLFKGRISDARKTLETYKELIGKLGEGVIQHWTLALNVQGGKAKRTRKKKKQLSKKAERKVIAGAVKRLASTEEHPVARFLAAETLAERGAWPELWEGQSFLVDELGTIEGFYLASFAAYHTLSADDALVFLDKAPKAKNTAELAWLRDMKLRLAADSGKIAGAFREAQQLLTDARDPSCLMLADLSMRMGDFDTLAMTIDRAQDADNPGLRSDRSRLQWARILRQTAPEVSRKLIESAPEQGAVRLASMQLDLALELFADQGPIVEQAVRKASRNKQIVRQLSLAEARELWITDLKATQARTERYEEGCVASHMMFRDRLGLAYLGTGVTPQHFHRPSAHAFHARRSCETVEVQGHLILDITAVLVVDALDLWDALWKSDIEIFLLHHWATTLTALRQDADVVQPNRFQALSAAVRSFQERQVRVIRFRPSNTKHVCFETDESVDADVALEHVSQTDVRNRRLWLDQGILEELHARSEFEGLSERCQLYISRDERERLLVEHGAGLARRSVAEKLEALIEKLRGAVNRGQLSVSPNPYTDGRAIEGNWSEESLMTGMRQADELEYDFWIDDRLVNGHEKTAKVSIVCTLDVLNWLVSQEVISQSAFYQFCDQLRALDFQFVLPDAEEIGRVMRKARRGDRAASMALARMDEAFYRFGVRPRRCPEEAAKLRIWEEPADAEMMMLCNRVIHVLLCDETLTDDEAAEHAIEGFAKFQAFICLEGSDRDVATWRERFVVAASLALSGCFRPDALGDEKARARSRTVVGELFEHAIGPAVEAWPELENAIVERLALGLMSAVRTEGDYLEQRIRRAATAEFIDILPVRLRDAVFELKAVADAFNTRKLVTIGEETIETDAFFAALDRLVQGEEQVVLGFDDGEWTASIDDDAIKIEQAAQPNWRLSLGIRGMLAGDSCRRRDDIAEHLVSFGFVGQEAKALGRFVARPEYAAEREHRSEVVLSKTMQGRLAGVLSTETQKQIAFEDVQPPPLGGAAGYLGFRHSDGGGSKEQAWERLVSRVGMEEAIRRYLDCPLPPNDDARAWFRGLAQDAALAVVEKWRARPVSFVSLRNLLDLLGQREDTSDEIEAERRAFIAFDPSIVDVQRKYAVAALHRFCREPIEEQNAAGALLGSWAWGAGFWSTLNELGVDQPKFADWYLDRAQSMTGRLASIKAVHDAAQPHRLTAAQIMSGAYELLLSVEDELNTDESDRLREKLSRPDFPFPSVTLVPARGAPDRCGTWISENYEPLLKLWPDADEQLVLWLSRPAETARAAAKSTPLELVSLSRAGVHHLDRDTWRRVIINVIRLAPELEGPSLRMAISLLQSNTAALEKDDTLIDRVFEALAQRVAQIEDRDAVDWLLHAVLESVILNQRENWHGVLERRMRRMAFKWAQVFGREQANFLRTITCYLAPEMRGKLARLEAELRSVSSCFKDGQK